jgi:hypothetical protein
MKRWGVGKDLGKKTNEEGRMRRNKEECRDGEREELEGKKGDIRSGLMRMIGGGDIVGRRGKEECSIAEKWCGRIRRKNRGVY